MWDRDISPEIPRDLPVALEDDDMDGDVALPNAVELRSDLTMRLAARPPVGACCLIASASSAW
jgi:hypothetical protein